MPRKSRECNPVSTAGARSTHLCSLCKHSIYQFADGRWRITERLFRVKIRAPLRTQSRTAKQLETNTAAARFAVRADFFGECIKYRYRTSQLPAGLRRHKRPPRRVRRQSPKIALPILARRRYLRHYPIRNIAGAQPESGHVPQMRIEIQKYLIRNKVLISGPGVQLPDRALCQNSWMRIAIFYKLRSIVDNSEL